MLILYIILIHAFLCSSPRPFQLLLSSGDIHADLDVPLNSLLFRLNCLYSVPVRAAGLSHRYQHQRWVILFATVVALAS